MKHHYHDPRTRIRASRQIETNESTIVTWIVAAGFLFIFFCAFGLPILHRLWELAR